MGLFKKNEEVLDLTLLQKKGILRKATSPLEEPNYGKTLDLTRPQPSVQPKSQDSPFDFLNTFAQNAEPNPSNLQQTQNNSEDFQHLKVKFEDLEYKMERLMERLARIESQLGKNF